MSRVGAPVARDDATGTARDWPHLLPEQRIWLEDGRRVRPTAAQVAAADELEARAQLTARGGATDAEWDALQRGCVPCAACLDDAADGEDDVPPAIARLSLCARHVAEVADGRGGAVVVAMVVVALVGFAIGFVVGVCW